MQVGAGAGVPSTCWGVRAVRTTGREAAATSRTAHPAGLFCPLPILLAAREMRKPHPGDLLEVVRDDPFRHRFVEMEEKGRKIRSLVEKNQGRSGPSPVSLVRFRSWGTT